MRGCPCGILYDLRYVVTLNLLCEASVRDSSTRYNCHKIIVMGDNRNKILTVVFITICRCSLGWIFGCAERRGAAECCIPVSEQRPMQRIKRLTASQSSTGVFLLRLSHVVHHMFIYNSSVLCTYIHSQDTAFGFQALQVQVVRKRLLPDLLLDPSTWISSSHSNYHSETKRSH